jgi:hypothetical protein
MLVKILFSYRENTQFAQVSLLAKWAERLVISALLVKNEI